MTRMQRMVRLANALQHSVMSPTQLHQLVTTGQPMASLHPDAVPDGDVYVTPEPRVRTVEPGALSCSNLDPMGAVLANEHRAKMVHRSARAAAAVARATRAHHRYATPDTAADLANASQRHYVSSLLATVATDRCGSPTPSRRSVPLPLVSYALEPITILVHSEHPRRALKRAAALSLALQSRADTTARAALAARIRAVTLEMGIGDARRRMVRSQERMRLWCMLPDMRPVPVLALTLPVPAPEKRAAALSEEARARIVAKLAAVKPCKPICQTQRVGDGQLTHSERDAGRRA